MKTDPPKTPVDTDC